MDTVYPEPLSRLHRRVVKKKVHKNNAARYKTQPVTFAEIQEVDEETAIEDPPTNSAAAASKSELDLKAKFEEFKRQRDRDMWETRLWSKALDASSSIAEHHSPQTPEGDHTFDQDPLRRSLATTVLREATQGCQRPSL